MNTGTNQRGQSGGVDEQGAVNGSGAPAASPGSGVEGSILNVISDLEARVAGLRGVHAQSERFQKELEARESALTERERQAEERARVREGAIAERERAAAFALETATKQAEESAAGKREIDLLMQSVEQRTKIAAEAEALAERQGKAAEERLSLTVEAEKRLGAEQARLEREAGVLTDAKRKVGEAEQAIRERERGFEGKRQELKQEQERLTQVEQKAAQRQEQLSGLERKIADQALALKEQERLLVEQEKRSASQEERLAERESQLAETSKRLAEQQRSGAAAVERARSEAEAFTAECEEKERALKELEDHLNTRMADLKKQWDEVEREKARASEQVRALSEQAAQQNDGQDTAISSGRHEMLQVQIGEARAEKAAAEKEVAQVREDMARLSAQLEEMKRTMEERKGVDPEEVSRRDRSIELLRAELEESQNGARAAERRADEMESRLTRAGAEGGGGGGGGGADAMELAKREEAIVVLKGRLEESLGAMGELKKRVERAELEAKRARRAAKSAGDGADLNTEWSARRRERLSRYKGLLQAQTRKIVAAQQALGKRHSEAEQVLTQRANLSALAETLGKAERRLAGTRARGGAIAAMTYIMITVGVLGVLSWQVTKSIWPGTYIASATIQADAQGRPSSDQELAAWKSYHEELTKNPSLMEMAADRMARRGITQYGSPADLAAKIKRDLYVQSAEPGMLTLELKEVGAERSRLVLDTYVTALKSVSDASREQRAEDLVCTIAQAATAGAEPLMDERLQRAGGLMGGATLAAALVGLLVWSRLSKSKQQFEHAAAVENALQGVEWEALEASMKSAKPPAAQQKERQAAKGKKKR